MTESQTWDWRSHGWEHNLFLECNYNYLGQSDV